MSFDNLTVDRSSQYVKWEEASGLTEAQKARVARGDLGEVQNITVLDDGSYRVQTELGTLTLSGPALDAIKDDLSTGDYITVNSKLDGINNDAIIDMTAILKLLAQTNMQKRQVDREVRHANRDMAMAEAHNAADEIRKGAMFNLIFGCVSGAINIGMGAMSAVGSFKALSQLKTPMQDVKLAQTEVKNLQSQQNLYKSQVELADSRTQLKTDQANLQKANETLKTKELDVTNKQKAVDELQAKFDQAKTVKEKAKLMPELEQARSELRTSEQSLATAKTEQQAAANAVKTSEATVQQKTQAVKELHTKALAEQENMVKQAELGEKRAQQRANDAQKKVDALEADLAKAKPADRPKIEAQLKTAKAELSAAQSDLRTQTDLRIQAEKDLTSLKSFKITESSENAKANLKSVEQRLGDSRVADPNTAYGRLALANERYNAAVTEVQTKATFYQALNQIGQGAAGITGTLGQTIEQTSQAASKEHDAQAEKAKTAADDLTAEMQTAAEIIKDVKDCLEAIRQSQNQVFQAIMQA